MSNIIKKIGVFRIIILCIYFIFSVYVCHDFLYSTTGWKFHNWLYLYFGLISLEIIIRIFEWLLRKGINWKSAFLMFLFLTLIWVFPMFWFLILLSQSSH